MLVTKSIIIINKIDTVEQEMDGIAIVQAFATCPGPDCLKEVIDKPYGTRVKVYTAIKSFLEKEDRLRVCLFVASLWNPKNISACCRMRPLFQNR